MISSSSISPVENPIAGLRRYGQAIWLDFIRRSLVTSGDLERLVENEGVAGITSNPTIFEKAIDGSDDYTSSIEELRSADPNLPAREVYERLVTDDIRGAFTTGREAPTATCRSRCRPGSPTTPKPRSRKPGICGRSSAAPT
jgi:hypothetical protein